MATNGNVESSTLHHDEITAIQCEVTKAGAAVLGAELILLDFDEGFLYNSQETRIAFIKAFHTVNPDVVFDH